MLDLTDAVTRLGEDGVSDQIWESASEHLNELELTNVVMAIAVINVWNRAAVTAHTPAAPLAVG